MNITYSNKLTAEQFNYLRKAVGWDEINEQRAKRGVSNSINFVALNNNETIGMVRIITDYGYVAYIADLVILPEYQGKGVGKALIQKVTKYLNTNLNCGEGILMVLVSAKGKESFYEKLGFVNRPNENFGSGMHMWIRK